MTTTMLDDAEVMHGLGPVPLLQRQSAVESRWTRTVPTSRESARRNLSVWDLPGVHYFQVRNLGKHITQIRRAAGAPRAAAF